MQTEPDQWAVDAWERYGPRIFNCEITGPEALRLVVEERGRKLREDCMTQAEFALRQALKETPDAQ